MYKHLFLKCTHLSLIILIALVALAGCQRAQRGIIDGAPSDTGTDTPVTGMHSNPVRWVWFIDDPTDKIVLLIDDPEDKDAFVAKTLQAPELVRIRFYDNLDPDMRPHRLIEFDFKNFLDAMTYLNRPEIAGIFESVLNLENQVTTYTFIQDVDYTYAKEEGDWQIKHVFLIDYVPGGKQAYLAYAKELSTVLIPPTQLKAVAAYDNYYGGSPHRLVELEFATQEDADAYYALEEVIQVVEAGPENQAGNWSEVRHRFVLRSDYINNE